jgi:predicted DNA-binding transcriptional regulator YafY
MRKFGVPKRLDRDLLLRIALLYSNFVARDSAREIVLQRIVRRRTEDALRLLARLNFARRQGWVVAFEYRAHAKQNPSRYAMHPYHIVVRSNNLYLAG